MPAVAKKNKLKSSKKTTTITKEKKFVSESLQKQKLGKHLQKKKTPKHKRRGVLYIKHLPHGFYEEQLRSYFSQFGAVTRLRLARSPKTLGSKGYAFIEFRYPEVAEIAADAMNNYLMFKNIIKTRFIPPSEIKHDFFRSGVKKIKKDGVKVFTSKAVEARERIVQNNNKLMTTNDEIKRTSAIVSKVQKQKQKLAALGIDFDIDLVTQNLGQDFMEAVDKRKTNTIADLELETEDEADETFNPSGIDVDSDDDFEDFEYDSEHTDDEDGIDFNIDNVKLENAIKIAKEASKTAVVKIEPAKGLGKKGKRNVAVESDSTAPAKKAKTFKNGKENKTISEKSVAKKPSMILEKKVSTASGSNKASKLSLKKKTQVDVEEVAEKKQTKRETKKQSTIVKLSEKPPAKEKKSASKKIEEPESPVVGTLLRSTRTKKVPAKLQNVEVEVTSPQRKAKGKKAPKVTEPKADKKVSKAKKSIATAEEDSAPMKIKKLAKSSTGIEKKKPAVKADKKLKLAAAASKLADSSEIVKVVKGKEIKGKKRVLSKK